MKIVLISLQITYPCTQEDCLHWSFGKIIQLNYVIFKFGYKKNLRENIANKLLNIYQVTEFVTKLFERICYTMFILMF